MAEATEVAPSTGAATQTVVGAAAGETPGTQTEQQQNGGEGQQSGEQKQEAKAPAGAPEKYDLKLPEGPLTLDLDAYTGIMKKHNISNEVAQALAEEYLTHVGKFATESGKEAEAARFAEREDRVSKWNTALESHKLLGGDNIKQTAELVNTALDGAVKSGIVSKEDMAEFRQHCFDTGLGSHPVLVAMAAHFGKQFAQDNKEHIAGAAAAESRKSDAEVFYGAK